MPGPMIGPDTKALSANLTSEIKHHPQVVAIMHRSPHMLDQPLPFGLLEQLLGDTGVTHVDHYPIRIGQGKQGVLERAGEIKHHTCVLWPGPSADRQD